MRIHFKFTPQMRERMEAGLSFLYTTRDGHRWYIDATLNMPYRQVDFAQAMYDAFSLDGLGFFPLYPSLSICQQALEEGHSTGTAKAGTGRATMTSAPPRPSRRSGSAR